MKNRLALYAFFVAFILTTLTSCEFLGDIFQAGMWVGIIIVIIVVLLILFVVAKIRKKG